jgi:segregation and condensation protein A
VPRRFRRGAIEQAAASVDPSVLGEAMGGLLRAPPRISIRHMLSPRVTVAERLEHLRGLLRRGRFSFEEAVKGADRVTVAVTLLALLELYRRGEGDWEQAQPFGEITVYRPPGADTRWPGERLEAAV